MPKENQATSVFRKDRKISKVFEQFISPGPGPGKYTDERTDFVPKKKYKNKRGKHTFISAERRFNDEPECVRNPGPGKYFEEKDPLAINGPRPKFDANFGSKSNRKVEDFLVQHENSPVYNLQDFNAIGQQKVYSKGDLLSNLIHS